MYYKALCTNLVMLQCILLSNDQIHISPSSKTMFEQMLIVGQVKLCVCVYVSTACVLHHLLH